MANEGRHFSVEKAPDSGDDKRSERLKAAVRLYYLYKVKRTPSHHRSHFELRQRAKQRAWDNARAEQQHRRVTAIAAEEPVVEDEPPQQPSEEVAVRGCCRLKAASSQRAGQAAGVEYLGIKAHQEQPLHLQSSPTMRSPREEAPSKKPRTDNSDHEEEEEAGPSGSQVGAGLLNSCRVPITRRASSTVSLSRC
jgi:hypothetical protein